MFYWKTFSLSFFFEDVFVKLSFSVSGEGWMYFCCCSRFGRDFSKKKIFGTMILGLERFLHVYVGRPMLSPLNWELWVLEVVSYWGTHTSQCL